MTTPAATNDIPLHETGGQNQDSRKEKEVRQRKWRTLFGSENRGRDNSATSMDDFEDDKIRPEKWSFGVLNDKVTDEVPGALHCRRKILAPYPLNGSGFQFGFKLLLENGDQTFGLPWRTILPLLCIRK